VVLGGVEVNDEGPAADAEAVHDFVDDSSEEGGNYRDLEVDVAHVARADVGCAATGAA
jgi:hypothetical protein